MNKKFIMMKYKALSRWIGESSKVLEIGCGNAPILKILPNLNYTGIDHNKNSIEKLKEKGKKGHRLDLNSLKSLKLDNNYDFILFIDILEHLHNPKNALNFFKKYLKKGGKIIVSLPNDYNMANKLRFIANKKIVKYPFWEHGHLHIYPIKEGQKFLKDQNLKIVKTKYLATQKPKFLPQKIKNLLAKNFPNSFSRVSLYLIEINQTN